MCPHADDQTPDGYDTHPYVASKRLAERPDLLNALGQLIDERNSTGLRQSRRKAKRLPDLDRRFLEAIANRSVVRAAPVWHQLEINSPETKKNTIKRLWDRKLLDREERRFGSRNCLLVEATDEGRRTVGGKAPKGKGRGGMAHRFISGAVVARALSRGNPASREWLIPGTNHPCDAAVRIGDEWHIYEVVMDCESNLISHLKACFIESHAISTATVVATTKRRLNGLREMINAELTLMPFRARIKFEPVETFLEE